MSPLSRGTLLGVRGRKRGRGARGGYITPHPNRPSTPRTPHSARSRQSGDSVTPSSTPGEVHPEAIQDVSCAAHSESHDVPVSHIQFRLVEEERDEALRSCNDLKLEVSGLKVDLTQERLTSKVLREKVSLLEAHLQEETLKVRNLESLNKQLSEAKQPGYAGKKQSQGSSFMRKLNKSLDRKYMSFAIAVEKHSSTGLSLKRWRWFKQKTNQRGVTGWVG